MDIPVALCIGNVLLDINYKCADDSLLKKYNLKPDDGIELEDWQMSLFDDILCSQNNHIIQTEDENSSGKDISSEIILDQTDLYVSPGGGAQNTARVMQWCLQNSLGRKAVAFTGCVGKDRIAKLLENLLFKEGLQIHYMNHPTVRTGACAALVTQNNQRSLCANIGASSHFSADYFETSELQQALHKVNCIFCEGFFLTHSVNCILDLIKNFPSKLFCLNLSAIYVCDEFFSKILEVLPFTDILFGNSEEFFLLGKKFGITGVDKCEDLVKYLLKAMPQFTKSNTTGRILVTTRANKSVIVTLPNGEILSYDVPLVENIVDTIGAGDSFVAGFLAAKFLKDSLDFSVSCGINIACKIIQQKGCTIPESSVCLLDVKMIKPKKI